MLDGREPKFARWMRDHGKQAVLKDNAVERLERASKAVSGSSRQDVLESMYGHLDPKPKGGTRAGAPALASVHADPVHIMCRQHVQL